MTVQENKTWIEVIIKTKSKTYGVECSIMVDVEFNLDNSIEDWVCDNFETEWEDVVDFKWRKLSKRFIEQKETGRYAKGW